MNCGIVLSEEILFFSCIMLSSCFAIFVDVKDNVLRDCFDGIGDKKGNGSMNSP